MRSPGCRCTPELEFTETDKTWEQACMSTEGSCGLDSGLSMRVCVCGLSGGWREGRGGLARGSWNLCILKQRVEVKCDCDMASGRRLGPGVDPK